MPPSRIAGAARVRRRFGLNKSWVYGLSLGVLLFLLGVVLGPWTAQRQDDRERLKPSTSTPIATGDALSVERGNESTDPGLSAEPSRAADSPVAVRTEPLGQVPREVPAGVAKLALVIDDLGRSLEVIDQLEALEIELSFSVLPFESRTPLVVERLGKRRREVLLHLPMEAGGLADPGPGALLAKMSSQEWHRRIDEALAAVPQAVGVNNHMGSLLSSRRDAMESVMAHLGRRGLFFLDSRTSPRSVGYEVARSLGLYAAKRHVFLDGVRSEEHVRAQFERWLERAGAHGSAIAIGHPYPETLAVLADLVPQAVRRGYTFVPVSQLLHAGSNSSSAEVASSF